MTETGKQHIVQIRGLGKSFGDLRVLNGVDLDIHRGTVVSIIGPSGSGKTTLLRCINLLETPDDGRVLVNGELIRMKRQRDGGAVPADRT